MESRFPDATDEEIERDEFCVICRDSLFEGSKPKKLTCNHIFHIDCLRSWLVMQQVCPTCRAEIPADAPQATPPAGDQPNAAAAPGGQAQPGRGADGTSSAVANGNGAVSTQQPFSALGGNSPDRPDAAAGVNPSSPEAILAQCLQSLSLSGSGQLSPLTPVPEILQALKQAEELAKYFREQTDFWMKQVQEIQQQHCQNTSGGAGSIGGPMSPAAPPNDLKNLASQLATPAMCKAAMASSAATAAAMVSTGVRHETELKDLRRVHRERWRQANGDANGPIRESSQEAAARNQ